MGEIKIFLDSDVIVSALLSEAGASFAILGNLRISKVVTNTIRAEVFEVARRLGIDLSQKDIFHDLEIIALKLDKARLVETYIQYVLDKEDSHVVAGAHKSKVNFLLTHNLKHYRVDEIKTRLGIIVMRPGSFLQYLRSQGV